MTDTPDPQGPAPLGPDDIMNLVRAARANGFQARFDHTTDRNFRRADLAKAPPAAPDAAVLANPEIEEDEEDEVEEILAPAPPPIDLDAERAAAHADGFAAGLAQGDAEGHARGMAEGQARAEAELAEARALFEAATLRLSHLEAAGLGTLTDTIAEAVKTLAAQRAGQMIDEMPAPFVKRVEALADRVAQGVAAVTVRLNPDDFAAIKPHLAGSDLLDPDRIGTDDNLSRGDVDIRSGAVQLRDVLFPQGAA